MCFLWAWTQVRISVNVYKETRYHLKERQVYFHHSYPKFHLIATGYTIN